MTDESPLRIAFVGSYVPRHCGIATFTHDLATAVSLHISGRQLEDAGPVTVVAMNDHDDEYQYGPQVNLEIGQHRREDYRAAADVLNASRVDAVCLQHEFGIYGGEDGLYLLELINRLQKPLVTTLHTVIEEPSHAQRQVLKRICERSLTVVVMSERARGWLIKNYSIAPEKIRMIHHGTPDIPFSDTERFKERFGVVGRSVLLTFGLLSPGKGIETMLDALAMVVPEFPEVVYIVLGTTHPVVRRESGESYLLSLESRAVSLHIQRNVIFHKRFVTLEDLCEYLQAADIYVTPYLNREQIVSGTLAYALASGRAIVSTPYNYAQELLAEGRGCLFEFGNAHDLATHLRKLLADPDLRQRLRRKAYDYGRSMIWSEVGRQYVSALEQATQQHLEQLRVLGASNKLLMSMSLPKVQLQHLSIMTDGTGIFQHSVYSTPNRHHGYSTDDNTRALIVTSMRWFLFHDNSVLRHQQTYLSFLHYAWSKRLGRFRNFLTFERSWRDAAGGDDCQGRALWALGYVVAHAPNQSVQSLAEELFLAAMPESGSLRHPRGQAFAILGLNYYFRQHPENRAADELFRLLAAKLSQSFAGHATKEWPWFEDIVTYENGRLPQALIIAGHQHQNEDLLQLGFRTLRWLLDAQSSPAGHLSIIGNDGWLHRGKEPARFDQQPVESAALIGACKAAYRASNNPQWLVEMRRCFEWFLGKNDGGVALIDFKTHGCHDGLTATGVNMNQGAESVLSWLLSLLIMHEMQTGDAPEIT